MVNKKGLSNIVATVLIVLLVLAAVVLVWNVIRPAIEGTGESIDIKSACLLIDLKPTKCTLAGGASPATITYQILQGNPTKVVGIIETDDGNVATNIDATPPANVLETASFPVPFTGTGNPTATTAAIITDSEGNDQTCDAVALPVACT
jgi:flagellin-like protein